ncbi:MAG: prolyl oligopeptidase family serine peptidase, partial [Candidatus Rokuibacteriota bacterium]
SGVARPVVRDARVLDWVLSPDRQKVAYAVTRGFERPGSGQLLADIAVHDFGAGRTWVVTEGARLSFPDPWALFSWSPTGKEIVYRAGGPFARDELHVVPVEGGQPRRIADGAAVDFEEAADRPLWDAAGRFVFFTRGGVLWRAAANGRGAERFATAPGRKIRMIGSRHGQIWSPDGGRSAVVFTQNPVTKKVGPARIDLSSGAVSQVMEEAKRYGGYGNEPAVSPDERTVAYVAEDAEHPPEIWLVDGDLARPRQASRVAPELAKYRLGAAKVIEWRGLDGDTLRGALVHPAGYEAGKRYPLIVVVYGGSEISNNLNRFGFHVAPVENLQLFATRGYAILLADSKLNVGTPMLDLLKTVMPGIDRAIELGVADPSRVGIMGHSYGAYSTLALVAQSRRFKAAVVRAGMGDLLGGYGQLSPDGTNYGLAWSESGQGRMGGSPWEFRERYLDNSPFLYLDRVRTPLLLIHGDSDDAVPPFLADQIFTGLRRLGKTVTYARYAGEGHWEGEWSYANQMDYLDRVLAWFERYLANDQQGRE